MTNAAKEHDAYPDKGFEFTHPPSPEITTVPPVTQSSRSGEDILLSLCPPKTKKPFRTKNKNLLIVSTLDGQITALDLNKDGEMIWSSPTLPGPMLSSTLSDLEMDDRGHLVKLIPSLSGKIYKLQDEVIEPLAMDVSTLLSSSLKMQENVVLTGGKETRTFGMDLQTGEILYECSMSGGCQQFSSSSPDTLKDILVVQRNVQTVKAHLPRTGEQKWNFSVSLHDVNFYPGVNLCEDVEVEQEDYEKQEGDNIQLKAVVPEGVLCATESKSDQVKWRRKFQTPLVDVWKISGDTLEHVDLFSKNTVPKRSILVDDDDDPDDDESPELYIGIHQRQMYIQESILMQRQTGEGITDLIQNPDGGEVSFPRVKWKPYLVSPSRTPYFDHGLSPDIPLLTFDQTLETTDAGSTALAIMGNTAEYPYDSGYYLYSDKVSLNAEDPRNLTVIPPDEVESETVVEFVYMNLWHWWKEVIFISLFTALMMNMLIYRPIVHQMRDNFQQRNRDLVQHFQDNNKTEIRETIIEKVVVVEVPMNYSTDPQTPSTNSEPSFGSSLTSINRQNSDFSSRYLSDFEPVQCLGRGGFGVVFESKNKYDDIHYAVKRITMPSSEESRKKVKREVKLHAKLDHKNVVRYFSTWEETPPCGWQEDADAWFADADIGTGPTPFDPTSTDNSFSVTGDGVKKKQEYNPLNPFQGFYNSNSNIGELTSYSKYSDSSYGVQFEHSANTVEKLRGNHKLNEESSGGIVFDEISEETGISEAVSLQMDSIENTESSSDSSDNNNSTNAIQFTNSDEDSASVSCVEALEWNEKENKSTESTAVKSQKQKSYMYIVMQLCLKDTLRDWLRINSDRKREEVISIFSQICGGVEYVHSQNLVHRDLKPSNIYFSTDGIIKIGDFGLVTDGEIGQEAGDSHLTPSHGRRGDCQHTDQVGTQTYMSPEQLKQKPYNHKVDIFSMGLIFLELLVPFSTQMERLNVLSDVKKDKFPPGLATMSEEKHLLINMLHMRPDKRPEAKEILSLTWLSGMPIGRRRLDTIVSSEWDILNEEILDN